MTQAKSKFRAIPAVDRVLREMDEHVERFGHERISAAVKVEIENLRDAISNSSAADEKNFLFDIVEAVDKSMLASEQRDFIPVFNLSGTILHTNLGRALLPDVAIEAAVQVAQSASNLEYDLAAGKRGDRDNHIEGLICELSGAEAATVVNNNAAAVLLTLNSLARKREVPVSRGELVEIGGSFRMPEIITSAGCKLVEIGTTNRTHKKDFRSAITADTALLLKVHTSNYRIEGFVSEVSEKEIAELAHENDIPFVIDLGSGNFLDFKSYGLPEEATVKQSLESGADVVTFSGDKLLGGPQCGIIAGRKDLVEAIKSNPLKRALRVDKMTLAALTEVLRLYQNPTQLEHSLPTLKLLTRPLPEIKIQAEHLQEKLHAALTPAYQVSVCECSSQVGSGALPTSDIPSYGLMVVPQNNSDDTLRSLAQTMRELPKPVIGRISNGSYLLDMRCLEDEQGFIEQLSLLQDLLT
ncbi:MAG: L-seryl-tRNA(Sec) selenium transferase [Gammaproteobacteria bacterium]|nr:L-seryl-tRNA(Sec) selenium transferase [Gammaproteobacteria bacterium]